MNMPEILSIQDMDRKCMEHAKPAWNHNKLTSTASVQTTERRRHITYGAS